MALMFGLSRPTPSTMSDGGRGRRAVCRRAASEPLPSMISTPPQNTARCWPINRSAIQPPRRREQIGAGDVASP